jgi:hypothetical protein
MFITPGRDTSLYFVSEGKASVSALDYKLYDYLDKPAGAGKLEWDRASNCYITHVNLPQGFYEIRIPASGRSFGIVSIPAYQGDTDGFFAISTHLSAILYRHPPEFRNPEWVRRCLAIVKRTGIRSIREMDEWKLADRGPGRMDWDYRMADTVRRYAEIYGIEVLNMTASFPARVAAEKSEIIRNHYCVVSVDLLKFKGPFLAMNRRWAGTLCGMQLGNEPDGKSMPGECNMSMVQAASWYLKQAGAATPLVAPALTNRDMNLDFLKLYMANGWFDYTDVITFHNYSEPHRIYSDVKAFREILRGRAKAGMPIWITECGKAWLRGKKRYWEARDTSDGKARALLAEDQLSAYYIAVKAVESKACGVEKYFPFNLGLFSNSVHSFSMLGGNYTPLRSMAAYVNCVSELANKNYIGDLNMSTKGLVGARVLADDKSAVAVLDTGTTETVTITLDKGLVASMVTIDGRPILPDARGRWKISGGMAYARLVDPKARNLINRNTPAMQLFKLAREYRPVPRKASPVVFQLIRGDIPAKLRSKYGYELKPESLRVQAFNLSEAAIKIKPELQVAPGLTATPAAGMDKGIEIAARSMVELQWKLNWSKSSAPVFVLVVHDRNARAESLTIPFVDTEKYFSSENSTIKTLALNDPAKWIKNASNGNCVITYDPGQKAIKVHNIFRPHSNFWIYPKYPLTTPDKKIDGAIGFSFELKARQGDGSNKYHDHAFIMFYENDENNGKEVVRYNPAPSEEWQTFKVKLNRALTHGVKEIAVGVNPETNTIDYWMRNFKVYYPK